MNWIGVCVCRGWLGATIHHPTGSSPFLSFPSSSSALPSSSASSSASSLSSSSSLSWSYYLTLFLFPFPLLLKTSRKLTRSVTSPETSHNDKGTYYYLSLRVFFKCVCLCNCHCLCNCLLVGHVFSSLWCLKSLSKTYLHPWYLPAHLSAVYLVTLTRPPGLSTHPNDPGISHQGHRHNRLVCQEDYQN